MQLIKDWVCFIIFTIKRRSFFDIVYAKTNKNMRVTTWLESIIKRYLYMILHLKLQGKVEIFNERNIHSSDGIQAR